MSITRSDSVLAAAIRELKELLGSRCSDNDTVREHHSHGESYHPPAAPDVVCFPSTTEEVAAIAAISARHGLPIVPFGAGTSLEGHVQALSGGITIDLGQMNRILRVGTEDLDVSVEAGVTRLQLAKALRNTGLMFPIDPGADATIGGMAATRASGTTAVRYGTMRENVLALKVVLADGRIITTGTRARKSSAGYDLTRLFVGSEGTLGIITEVTLRLHPVPEAVSAAVCSFDTLRGAVDTVIATIQLGVPVARIELLDDLHMDALNRYSKTSYAVAPTLLFEFHGENQRHVSEQAATVQELAAERGGRGFEWATRPEDRDRLWDARHNAHFAALALRPGCRSWAGDVCVPISKLADCIIETKRDHENTPVSGAPRRARRRRQLPPGLPARPRAARRARGSAPPECADGGTRPRDGWHVHRRTRRRLRQDEVPHRRARRRGCRHARHQTRARPR